MMCLAIIKHFLIFIIEIPSATNRYSVKCDQCYQIVRVLKVLGIKFAYKIAQNIGDFLGYFKNEHLM